LEHLGKSAQRNRRRKPQRAAGVVGQRIVIGEHRQGLWRGGNGKPWLDLAGSQWQKPAGSCSGASAKDWGWDLKMSGHVPKTVGFYV